MILPSAAMVHGFWTLNLVYWVVSCLELDEQAYQSFYVNRIGC